MISYILLACVALIIYFAGAIISMAVFTVDRLPSDTDWDVTIIGAFWPILLLFLLAIKFCDIFVYAVKIPLNISTWLSKKRWIISISSFLDRHF